MRDGSVVEQGYRRELENSATGWFRHLAYSQASAPEQSGAGMDEEDEEEELIGGPNLMVTPPRENRLSSLVRRISFSPGNAFEPEATGGRENLSYSGYKEFQQNQRQSRLFVEEQQERRRSPSPSPANSPSLLASPSMQMTRSHSSQRAGLPALSPYTGARPKSMYGSPGQASIPRNSSYNGAGLERAIASSPARHTKPSPGRADGSRDSWYQLKEVVTRDVEAKESDTGSNKPEIHPMPAHQSLFKLLRIIFPLLPNKFYVILAFIGCAAAGFCTPLFSFQFSQLITALSAPGTVNVIQVAATALGIAAANGLLDWMTFTGLSRLGARWVYRMQKEGYEKVLLQDKAWFDEAQNASTSLMTALVKDSTDANGVLQLVGINIIVVFAMLMFGIIWAFVVGWQLTLIGLSLSPLFGVSLWFGSRLLNKYERINRAQREECAKRFFTSVSNVKAIRSMSLEPVLHSKFEDSVKAAYHGGTKSAFWTGFGAGIIFLVMYAAQGEPSRLYRQRSCSKLRHVFDSHHACGRSSIYYQWFIHIRRSHAGVHTLDSLHINCSGNSGSQSVSRHL